METIKSTICNILQKILSVKMSLLGLPKMKKKKKKIHSSTLTLTEEFMLVDLDRLLVYVRENFV